MMWHMVISGLYSSDKACKQCNIEFTDISDLKRHQEMHQALSCRNVIDRNREMNHFEKYLFDEAGRSIGTLISGENGRNIITEMFFGYFSSFRNQHGNIPSVRCIKKIKDSIRLRLKEDHQLDVSSSEFYPEFSERWKVVMSVLYGKLSCMKCGLECPQ